ncbi:MAG: spore germination protein GerW family protein [Terriglobales bacterium]
MEAEKFFESLREGLATSASIKSVYGDPIVVGTKTVIPVARIAYGFGGGMGRNGKSAERPGEGAGAGGGMAAVPIGVVEITPERTRFLRFGGTRRLAAALAVGMLFGMCIGRRCRR